MMTSRQTVVLLVLLLWFLAAAPPVRSQCAITNAAILLENDPAQVANNRLSDRSNLQLIIRGETTGSQATSVVWRRNGTVVNRTTVVAGGSFYDGGGETILDNSPCSTHMFRVALLVTGYLPGEYSYTVNNDQTTSPVTSPVFRVEDPGPPTNLMVRQVSGKRLEFSWSPPSSGSGATYHYYENTTDYITGGADTTATTRNTDPLVFGTSYFIHVRATTGTYLSVPATSDTITVRNVLSPTTTPTSVSGTSVSLTLSQPSDSLSVDMYSVVFTSTACPNIESRSASTTTNSLTVDNLEAGVLYSYTLTGANTVAELNGTTTSTTTTMETAPSGSPGVPTVSATTATSISISWTQISCIDRNGDITGYRILYGPANNASVTLDHQSTSTSRDFTGLSPFTNYNFSVSGVNSQGAGAFSAEAILRTGEDRPSAVTDLRGQSLYFSVVLMWAEPQPLNGLLQHYTVTYAVNGSSTLSNMTRTTSFTVSNLYPNTQISDISVTATTGGGEGPAEMLMSLTTLDKPGEVMNVMVEVLSEKSVRVTWDISGFQEISMFVVYYRQVGGSRRQMGEEMKVEVNADVSFVEIADLSPGVVYQFEVVAVITVGGVNISGSRSRPITSSQPTSSPSPAMTLPLAPIIGGIIAATVLIVLVVLAVFLIFLYRSGHLCCGPSKSDGVTIAMGRYDPTQSSLQDNNDYILKNEAAKLPPQLEEFPEPTSATEGEDIIFKIVVSGKPTPTLTWKFKERELASSPALLLEEDGSLRFPSVGVDQTGRYVLLAENSAGAARREVQLTVEKEEEGRSPGEQALDIKPLPLAEFGEYVAENHGNNNRGFRDQFQKLYDGEDKDKTVGLSVEYKKLNRFANITVYDDNRIELEALGTYQDCQQPFINACYVDGYSKPKKFIASQGPFPKMMVDFWRMIWQEKPGVIVMVTNLKEGNKSKCHQYWPETGSAMFGPFKVLITDSVVLADYCIRTLQVSLEGNDRPCKITQFHFTDWPDHGVPDYATPMLAFHRRVSAFCKGKKGPVLVHCSAGVGRTGTFICIDNMLEQIQEEGVVDVAGTITKIRQQRMKMVQAVEQYIFLHDAILESMTCGDTQIAASGLRFVLRKYGKVDPETGLDVYQAQFNVLAQVSPKTSEVVCTAARRNPEKNRSMDYLPADRYRLMVKGEAEGYVHAAFAHGYKHKKAYIMAENPMTSTVTTMLKVMYNRNVGVAVMLSLQEERGQECCARYWPDLNQVTMYGEYEVDNLSEEDKEGYTVRTISILNLRTQRAHQVKQFHITCWQADGFCSSLATVVQVIEETFKVQRKTGNKPIFVHCSDTVTRSGIFCALASTIDCCKTEGVVDVFQVVKALRIQKPGAVPSVEHYKMIFDGALAFLDSFDTYANFQS